jgi:uncharacterized protein (TIGR03118 family)
MKQSGTTQPRFGRGVARAASLGLALLFVSSFLTPVFAQYKRTDLISNQPGVAPTTDEQHLANAWGLTALPRSPFWVSDNGTGFSTLYTGAGQQIPLFVTIASAPGSPAGTLGTPTGTVGNISPKATDFTVTENGKSGRALFIFATLDGTISGWNPEVDRIDPTTGATHTTLASDRSNVGAAYTGLAIATNKAGQTFLYAADDGPNRRIDIFDGAFSLVKSFGNPAIPRGFSPYGIQTINGHIWVTFTVPSKAAGWLCGHF